MSPDTTGLEHTDRSAAAVGLALQCPLMPLTGRYVRCAQHLYGRQMDVFLLWHVRHARNLDGSPTEHREEDGELAFDEEFDDLKIIGAYESEEAAEAAIGRTRQTTGVQRRAGVLHDRRLHSRRRPLDARIRERAAPA